MLWHRKPAQVAKAAPVAVISIEPSICPKEVLTGVTGAEEVILYIKATVIGGPFFRYGLNDIFLQQTEKEEGKTAAPAKTVKTE